jgi:ribosome-associated toxin RatA of RatAB toxin-antitoxin module
MAVLKREITINAAVEEVFAFVAESPKLVEVWPSLVNVETYGRDENGLAKLTFTYMMAGVRFKVYCEDSVYKENELIVTNTRSGFESIVTWAFEPIEGGTLVKFRAEYKIPVPLIGRLAENVVVTFNDMDIRVMLQNLKSKLEAVQEMEKVP